MTGRLGEVRLICHGCCVSSFARHFPIGGRLKVKGISQAKFLAHSAMFLLEASTLCQFVKITEIRTCKAEGTPAHYQLMP